MQTKARWPKIIDGSLLRWVWLAVCLATSAFFVVRATSQPTTAGVTSEPVGRSTVANLKPIEQIRVGERVKAENPEMEGDEEPFEFDAATWRRVKLEMSKSSGSKVDIELLRPDSWFAELGARLGTTVDLDLHEMGAVGAATVMEIGPCPNIMDGDGSVVTGTFQHQATDILEVHVEGLDEPIRCTPNHPFWSVDREDFVEAGALRNGDRLTTVSGGIARVDDILAVGQPSTVYNLEVHFDHVYFVSPLGILVHNSCQKAFGDLGEDAAQRYISDFVDGGQWRFAGKLQNKSGHGIDLVFEKGDQIKKFLVVEVKASRRRWRNLSKLQSEGVEKYTTRILNKVGKDANWKNLDSGIGKLARDLKRAMNADPGRISGYLVQIRTSHSALKKFAKGDVGFLKGIAYSDWDDWIR